MNDDRVEKHLQAVSDGLAALLALAMSGYPREVTTAALDRINTGELKATFDVDLFPSTLVHAIPSDEDGDAAYTFEFESAKRKRLTLVEVGASLN